MSDVSKVVDRIRKLLGLSGSNNPNEAASAAGEAARLMREHKLTAADVDAQDGSKVTELPLGAEGFRASWKFALVTDVARTFFCEVVALRVGQRRKVRVVGRKDDAEVTVGVFGHLVREITRLADEDVGTYEARLIMGGRCGEGGVDVRTYKERFRQGAAKGVVDGLRRDRETFASSGERALAVVDRSKEELRSYLRSKYGESKVVGRDSPKAGVGAGAGGAGSGGRPGTRSEVELPADAELEAYFRGYQRGCDVVVPRTGGAERFLVGEVRSRREEEEENVFRDSVFKDLKSDVDRDLRDLDELDNRRRGFGWVNDIDQDLYSHEFNYGPDDLSRGRGGRSPR